MRKTSAQPKEYLCPIIRKTSAQPLGKFLSNNQENLCPIHKNISVKPSEKPLSNTQEYIFQPTGKPLPNT